ncbi:MAG: elongation factor G [Bacillota bacterium]
MKKYDVDQIRNIAFLGHGGSGKTTLVESIAKATGKIDEMGSVENGTTISDFMQQEKKKEFSIASSVVPVEYENSKYNLLDTPGYFDFVGEAFCSLRVAGGAVITIDASSGIEVGTEKAWKFTKKRNMPKIIFVNKMDLDNVNYVKIIKSLKDKFGNKIAPFAIPNGEKEDFTGFVNVVDLVGREYDGNTCSDVEISDDLYKKIDPVRELLIEAVAESDDELLEKYFEGEEFTTNEIHEGLRKGVLGGEIVPVLIGSATKSIGTHTLLDMLYDYMPTPKDMNDGVYKGENPETEEEIERKIDEDEEFSGLIFKTIIDPFVGKISIFKVYSGSVQKGDEILNATKNDVQKVGKIFYLSGKEQIKTDKITSGDIGAVSKLEGAQTGDTICCTENPIIYPQMSIPQPAVYKSIHLTDHENESKLATALHRLSEEDLSFVEKWNSETKETLIGGQGNKQLKIIKDRLEDEFEVKVTLDTPKVAYRETITEVASVRGKHKKQSGGSGQYGIVDVKFEPSSEEYVFEQEVVGGAVPTKFISAVEKGIEEALDEGGLAGYKVVNIKATLYDGDHHPVDSSDNAFKAAGRKALRNAYNVAKPVLLEPIMHVEVYVPDENMGDIMGDMNKRRGRILGMEKDEDGFQKVIAEAPQAEMFDYLSTLNSITKARGFFNMRFERYEEVPMQIAMDIIEESK